MSDALEAFREVNFHYVRPLDSIWTDSVFDVDDLNLQVLDTILSEFWRETRDPRAHAIGEVAVGTAGVGKTHLVGRLRQRVWQKGGWFVLLDIVGLKDFWLSAALCFANALQQRMPNGDTQGIAILRGIARSQSSTFERQIKAALDDPGIAPLAVIDLLLRGLRRTHGADIQKHQDVLRALYLFCSLDYDASNLAYAWLQGLPVDEGKSREFGFSAAQGAPAKSVSGLSWIMSLTGPTLVAVDQIDALVNPSSFANASAKFVDDDELPLGEILAAGLLELDDARVRGMTVVTCLEATWQVLVERSLHSFKDRFSKPARRLVGLKDAKNVERLIERRVAATYREMGFNPPFPTWPFSSEATESAVGLLPRQILMRCEEHRRFCSENGNVILCESLVGSPSLNPHPIKPDAATDDYAGLFQRHRSAADTTDLLNEGDDSSIGHLLRDTLDLYVRQLALDDAVDAENRSDSAQRKPPLHGRLTFTFHVQNDREKHFCFRAIEHTHAIAFQARLSAALTAAGIALAIPDRHLVIVRRSAMPKGPKTAELIQRFIKAGGVVINPSDDDLRTFVALRAMRDEAGQAGKQDTFDAWLRTTKPLLATAFFQQAGLNPVPTAAPVPARPAASQPEEAWCAPAAAVSASTAGEPSQPAPNAGVPPTTPSSIPIGHRMAVGNEQVNLPIKLLPRHTAIIAGSGSGKTVLLRRIVEEAALAGIPAIVIDPNNDLSRLGDPWPDRPDAFTPEDDAKALRYRDTVDVVVWTPGIHAGNPLFLSVLPDFASLGDDRDEREQAVDMAAETLGPLAGAKTTLQRGVLAEALRHFASRGGGDLRAFTALLADLPDGVSPIGTAGKLAAGMADQLHAAVATNPLLKADGAILDPKLLFFGPDPARTRVSVINLSGLASEAAREDFVNRLQMTLFGWIKKHPSRTGLLYVIDEAQNFLPAQKAALSLGSGLKLVAQARKYGLGLIVATQVPRGIHNQVVSNCTTQFFGKQNAPNTIAAARAIIAASGGTADDIGKLKTGEFYFATEGSGKPGKLRTPLCLTYHPANPPTPDEVLSRVKRLAVVPALP